MPPKLATCLQYKISKNMKSFFRRKMKNCKNLAKSLCFLLEESVTKTKQKCTQKKYITILNKCVSSQTKKD